ncbi:monocarboxylate transporter 12-like isoform X1 [Pecten maximus]|uniref:monocarboxylate transporter 12-like isoform X1 n=1 Tax=Pecten maximus TaxID=6579 RepID=UPI0014586F0E|nr:monocarboxylate transporter 12-like isoform X1 [Pecten maximus]
MMRKTSSADVVNEHPTPVQAPDGGWGWMVTFSSLMINVLIDGIFFTYGIFFPEFLRHFGESKGKTQLLHSILVGTCLTSGPVVSVLVNKYDIRKVAATGTVIASVGLFLSTFSPNLNVMLIFYSIAGGIGFGILYLPSIVIIGVYFNKRRALATGIAVCGAGVGTFVFAPITKLLLEAYNWRGATWIMSAIVLNGVVFSAIFRPPGKDMNRNDAKIKDVYDKCDTGTVQNPGGCFRQFCLSMKDMFDFSLLKSPTMLLYGASCLLVMFGFFIPSNFLPVWASDANLSTGEGAFLISAMGVSNTIARVVIGYITDKPWANCLIINNIALLIGGLATCFVPFYTTFAVLVVYAVVFGIVMAVFILLRSILMAELLGVHRLNSSFGLVGLSMGLSTFVGSPLAGALSDISGNYNVAFYFGGITIVLGGLICLPLRRISNWEQSRRNDFNLWDTYNGDEKNKRPDVKIVSAKKTLSIYTISRDRS